MWIGFRHIEGTLWRSLRAVGPAAVAMLVVLSGADAVGAASVSPPAHRSESAPGLRPPRVVVLGDSVALTLGVALQATAPSGTTVVNAALFGCGMAIASWASNDPPHRNWRMLPACNAATPTSGQWPAIDAKAVEGTTPRDVVLFVAGTWETQDLLRDGRWTNITQPSFQRYELSQMRLAVRVGTAHGARFDFTTMPAEANGAAFGEPPFPQDSPKRRLIYDRLIRTVAAEFPRQVKVIDLGAILSPEGKFTEYRDGVQIRTPDGIHTPAYAPDDPYANTASQAVATKFYDWISPRIWPLVVSADPSPVRPAATSS